jgi:AraC-like DNA-binding protein
MMEGMRINELASILARHATSDGVVGTAIPQLEVIRDSGGNGTSHLVHEPSFCIIASARKIVDIMDERLTYVPGQYLVATVAMPTSPCVVDATPEAPYYCLKLDLDTSVLADLLLREPELAKGGTSRGLFVGDADAGLVDAVVRLAGLLDSPRDIDVMAPLTIREIYYRLLRGKEGARIAQIAMADSHTKRIARAVSWLRENFAEPLKVTELARLVHMSPSSFHEHFRGVTAMSPLQFQKQLRLVEARRLLMSTPDDAATIAHNVGYESPSQFSREYARAFGEPPARSRVSLRPPPYPQRALA